MNVIPPALILSPKTIFLCATWYVPWGDRSLSLQPELGLWGWILLLATLAAMGWDLQQQLGPYRRQRQRGQRRPTGPPRNVASLTTMLWAWALRSIALFSLLLGLLRPMLLSPAQGQSQARFVVLADRSASLAVHDKDPGDANPRQQATGRSAITRDARLQKAWKRAAPSLQRLQSRGISVELRHFDEALHRLETPGLFDRPATGESSRLDQALAALRDEGQRDPSLAPLVGALVLSDAQVFGDPQAQTRLRNEVSALGVPLSVVSGAGQDIRDLSLHTVGVPEFAFVENVTHFEVRVQSHGLSAHPVQVKLTKNGELVDEQEVLLGEGSFAKTLRFRVAPEQTGQFVYRFFVADQGEEATLANNEARFLLRVLRDKIRVLHVAGRPDWDVRSLRTLLKRDPNVELLSYYILRSHDDQLRDDPMAPMSLIGFPHRELFEEQLGSFDLIVLHNFDARTHADYIGNFAEYVEQGGSLVLIGGDLGLATGDYNEAPLQSILPAVVAPQAPLEGQFQAQLSAEGEKHPLSSWMSAINETDTSALAPKANNPGATRSSSSQDMKSSVWPGLSQLNAARPSDSTSIKAQTLLTASRKQDSQAYPLLALSEPGKGRLLMLLTGQSWRLGFAEHLPLVDGLRPYDQLWRHILRWALQQSADQGLEVEIHPPHAKANAPVIAKIRSLDPEGKSQGGVSLQYQLQSLDAPENPSATARQNRKSDEKGQLSISLHPLQPGAYRFRLARTDHQEPDQESALDSLKWVERVFLVGQQERELQNVEASGDQQQLSAIAKTSGGEFHRAPKWPADVAALPRVPPTRAAQIHAAHTQAKPLWQQGWLWIAVSGLLAEWWIRRRHGYR